MIIILLIILSGYKSFYKTNKNKLKINQEDYNILIESIIAALIFNESHTVNLMNFVKRELITKELIRDIVNRINISRLVKCNTNYINIIRLDKPSSRSSIIESKNSIYDHASLSEIDLDYFSGKYTNVFFR